MLKNRDILQSFDLLQKLIECDDHDQFVDTLVRTMHPLMHARVTGYNEADPVRKRFGFVVHPRDIVTDDMIQGWVKHADENPLLQHVTKNPGDLAVYKITDFVPQAEFRKTALCRRTYRPMGAEYQIAMPLLLDGSAAVAVVFNRAYDFNKRDRELLTLLQPLVSAVYRIVEKMTELQIARQDSESEVESRKSMVARLRLSDRHLEVLRHLVRGKSNKQIAGQLKLSIRTVEKYVEHLLKKLKVRSRSAACAKFQDLFSMPGAG
jgi:DNA-binding CsgD family transcriptional regulator